MFSSSWYLNVIVVLIILLADVVLCAPQGYNYYANQQQSYYAQRAAQAQRIQAQRIAAQNRYFHQQSYKTTTTTRKPYKINRADSENAKFLGLQNQESVESGKTFKKKAKLLAGGYGPGYGNGCGFRNADQEKGEGRVFWDLNFYNVYPGGGCGGGVGGGAGIGGLADPYTGAAFDGGYPGGFGGGWADPYYGGGPIRRPFQNLLGLFLPGGALSGVNRPSAQGGSQADTTNSGSSSTGGVGPDGPNFQFLNDADVMPSLTPNQLVSGVASTVNNVLQQLSYPFYG